MRHLAQTRDTLPPSNVDEATGPQQTEDTVALGRLVIEQQPQFSLHEQQPGAPVDSCRISALKVSFPQACPLLHVLALTRMGFPCLLRRRNLPSACNTQAHTCLTAAWYLRMTYSHPKVLRACYPAVLCPRTVLSPSCLDSKYPSLCSLVRLVRSSLRQSRDLSVRLWRYGAHWHLG